jgi:hypothetical protein
VLLLYSYCAATVLLLYSYCTPTVLLLYSYCTPTVLLLYSYPYLCTVLSYCTYAVLLLYANAIVLLEDVDAVFVGRELQKRYGVWYGD